MLEMVVMVVMVVRVVMVSGRERLEKEAMGGVGDRLSIVHRAVLYLLVYQLQYLI